MKKKLAIVGSGISAMSCVYRLKDDFDITIFEKNGYLGGHTHTHRLEEDGHEFTVDTGFIVFNHKTYPNLIKMFSELGVREQKCSMSFSVWNASTGLQYCSDSFFGLFAQSRNWVSPRFWGFLLEAVKFYRVARRDRETIAGSDQTIGEYCRSKGLSEFFIDNLLAPLSSAVWSAGMTSVYDFPIAIIIPFFHNHGMLKVRPSLQWYSVPEGSDDYTKKIVAAVQPEIRLNEAVQEVSDTGGGVKVRTAQGEYDFDYAIVASHADDSVKLVPGLSEQQKQLLGKFGYTPNKAVLHTDSSVMPPLRRAWAAWNHVIQKQSDGSAVSSTVYWMNPLQHTKSKKNYFVSINPFQPIDPDKIVKEIDYHHPDFTVENFAVQEQLPELNKSTRILFSGAYFGYGFHEDGMRSGVQASEQLKKNAEQL